MKYVATAFDSIFFVTIAISAAWAIEHIGEFIHQRVP